MAIVSLTTIKNWFKTGLKPTQAQFWDVWDSFRHKSEAVPYESIEGLDAVLLAQDVKINAIALPDDVIKDGEVYVSGTNVDILANDFIWRLLQVQYTNAALYHTVLPFSASGYTRTDIFVGTNLGTIYRVAGEERVGVAFKPSVPPGTIEIASVDVDDAVVGVPVIPKPKQPVSSVNGMRGEVVLTKSDIGLGNVDNTSDANKPVSTAQAAADAAVLATAQSYTDSKVSSVYKFKGNVANYAALPSTGLTVGDVYNLSDTGANYAWTGTVWDDLGTTVDISGKENVSNKSQDIETDKTSTSKYGSVKAVYDWAVAKFQAVLVSGTNIKTINGTSLLGSGDITISGGGGDMVLASTQTVSGLKTFLSGMLGLRNVANTFTSFFTNANTAARTYTLPDKNGSIPVDSDIVHIAGNETISGIKSFSTKIIVMADVSDPYAESVTVVQNATAGGAFYIKNNANNVFLGGFSMANNDLRFANYVSTGKVLFYSNGMDRIAIFPSGNIQIKSTINGTATDDTINKLQVDGSIKATQFRLSALNTAPSSSADTGTTGEIRFDANYMYVCVATNTWKRSALTTW